MNTPTLTAIYSKGRQFAPGVWFYSGLYYYVDLDNNLEPIQVAKAQDLLRKTFAGRKGTKMKRRSESDNKRQTIEPLEGRTIEINQEEDPVGAERRNPHKCVVALALMKRYKGLDEVDVFPTVTILRWSSGIDERFQTSTRLRKALGDFDAGKGWNLKTGTYKLLPIPPSSRREANKERAKKRRLSGDKHMDTKYPNKKRPKMQINPRYINMKFVQA